MDDYKKAMGQRIKSRRKKLLLTQEEIAEQLNISVKHFSEVERGLSGLSIENLIKLSDIIGLSLDYMIKGDSCEDRIGCGFSFENIPKEKEHLIKNLIEIAVKLSKY